MTNTSIPDTAVNNLTDESEPTVQPVNGYMPTFGDTAHTIVYVVTLIASIVGLGFMYFCKPAIGNFISIAAGVLSGGFGVTYNPVR